MRKKIIALILALCMCVPQSYDGFAAAWDGGSMESEVIPGWNDSDVIFEGVCGDNLNWTLDSDGTLTISGTGEMWDYKYDTAPFSSNEVYVRQLVVEDGVTSIGDRAFYCSSLISADLGNTVERIGSEAFSSSYIERIELPDSVMNIDCSFSYCENLRTIELSSGMTKIGPWEFEMCSYLESITIPGSIKTIDWAAFYGCERLDNIIVEESVYFCVEDGVLFTADKSELVLYPEAKSGEEYIIPDTIQSIREYAFCGSDLVNVVIGENVTNIGFKAFSQCGNLTEVSIPDKVKRIEENAFEYCSNLNKMVIPDGVEYIGYGAFEDCSKLTIYGRYGSAAYDFAEASGIPFDYSDWVMSVELDRGAVTLQRGESVILSATVLPETALNKNLIWKSSDESVATVEAVDDNTGIVVANNIGNATVYAISEDGSLSAECSVAVFGDIIASGNYSNDEYGTDIGWEIDETGNLTIVGEGWLDIIGYKEAPWFPYASMISRVVIRGNITRICSFADYTTWETEYVNLESVEIIDGKLDFLPNCAFADCEKLKAVWINGVREIWDGAFYNCKSLEKIMDLSDLIYVEGYPFYGCNALTIYAENGTYAEVYASENNIPFVDITPKVVTGVSLDTVNIELNVGETTTLTATVAPENASNKNIIWSSSDSSVAEVDELGKVTAVSEGTAVITVTTMDGGYTADCTVKVVEPVKIIERGTCGENAEWILDEFGVLTIAGMGSMIDFGSSGTAPWYALRTKIKTIVVQSGINYIGSFSFSNLIYTQKAIIADSVTDIGKYAFYKCTGLAEINIPREIENINFYAFFKCDALVDVYADSVESWCSIKFEDRFANPLCYAENLRVDGDVVVSVVFPKGITSVNDYLFCGYQGLTNVTLPDGVETVGNHSFFECKNLSSAEIPQSIFSIGDYAFEDCDNLTIYGYSGSYAEGYALENSIPFVALSDGEQEITPITYSFGQSVQIGLIEPWFLKANARVYTDEKPTNIDYSSLVDYGAYFIRASALADENATQESLTVEDIINNPAALKYSKEAGTATVDGSYITANYDKGLYTFEISDSIFVVFYIEDENGITYAPIRERNIKTLLEARKDDNINFKNELERNVYTSMDELEKDIKIYRSQFEKIEELPIQKAPTLKEYVAVNGSFEQETTKSYSFGNSVQLILVEPWGLKVNARVYNSEKPTNINYSALEEYGAIVFYDTEGTISSMTADELKTKEDAYVFSSKNGDATVDGSYITALYNKGIFTYQLNSNAYVMFYVKDENGCHYSDVKVRNAYELAKIRGADTTGTFGEAEKTVYDDMVEMHESVNAYRDDYFSKN